MKVFIHIANELNCLKTSTVRVQNFQFVVDSFHDSAQPSLQKVLMCFKKKKSIAALYKSATEGTWTLKATRNDWLKTMLCLKLMIKVVKPWRKFYF